MTSNVRSEDREVITRSNAGINIILVFFYGILRCVTLNHQCVDKGQNHCKSRFSQTLILHAVFISQVMCTDPLIMSYMFNVYTHCFDKNVSDLGQCLW